MLKKQYRLFNKLIKFLSVDEGFLLRCERWMQLEKKWGRKGMAVQYIAIRKTDEFISIAESSWFHRPSGNEIARYSRACGHEFPPLGEYA